MHSIEIQKVEWRNFFRYGNNLNYVDFDKGLSIIRGDNGLGKTTIENVISYCFFGKINRKDVKIDQLINKKNKKNLFTAVEFLRVQGTATDSYKIIRTLKPKKISIFKNGTELTSVPSDIEGFISRDILGFNINMIKNIFSVSPLEVDAFLNMEAKDKRKLIETVFNLSKIEIYLKNANIKYNEYEFKSKILNTDIQNLNQKIANLENLLILSKKDDDVSIISIVNRKNAISNDIALEEAKIYDSENKNTELTQKISTNTDLLKIEEAKLSELNPTFISNEIYKLKSDIERYKKQYESKRKEKESIKEQYVCQQCGTLIDNAEKAKIHSDNLSLEMTEIKNKAKACTDTIKSYDIKVSEINELNIIISDMKNKLFSLKDTLTTNNYDIKSAKANINRYNSDLAYLDEQINQISTNSKASKSAEITDNISDLKKELAKKFLEVTEVTNSLESCQYLIKMFSDEGIKKFLLKKFIPIFNKLINHYLTVFNLNTTLIFDEYFDYSFISMDDVGDTYGALSGGQRNRINIAILFALNDLVGIIGNFKCNSLFIDEFIDSSVDSKGIIDAIAMLKDIADRYNKSIFLISHKAGKKVLEQMDHCYRVFDDNGFSVINKLNTIDEINKILDEST